jgi:peptidoglycan hydrolase CwlO-like protein
LKAGATQHSNNEIEILRLENMRLISENETLCSRLEMQQHHSGGLGAAMLQEKLEGQERKIAILELSAKGTVEVRAELERLQNSISNLQKSNLCLEAENLELKLDLEKSTKEVPHLREQIHHLEK